MAFMVHHNIVLLGLHCVKCSCNWTHELEVKDIEPRRRAIDLMLDAWNDHLIKTHP